MSVYTIRNSCSPTGRSIPKELHAIRKNGCRFRNKRRRK